MNPPTQREILRASEVCSHGAKHPLNAGEIAGILSSASRILKNTVMRGEPDAPPAQVTKQHLKKIIDEIRVGDRSMRFDITDAQAAQLLADSEAKACAELRTVFSQILAALGNGSCCTPDVSLDFIQSIPKEVTLVVDQLRAERDWLKTWQDQAETNYVIGEPLAKKLRDTEVERDQLRAELARLDAEKPWLKEANDTCALLIAQRDNLLKPMRDQAIDRAERAEAELHALRLVCGTTDADKFSTWVDRANARADEAEHDCRVLIGQLNAAEAELATERAKVSKLRSAMKVIANDENYMEQYFDPCQLASSALAATEETKP